MKTISGDDANENHFNARSTDPLNIQKKRVMSRLCFVSAYIPLTLAGTRHFAVLDGTRGGGGANPPPPWRVQTNCHKA